MPFPVKNKPDDSHEGKNREGLSATRKKSSHQRTCDMPSLGTDTTVENGFEQKLSFSAPDAGRQSVDLISATNRSKRNTTTLAFSGHANSIT